MSAHGSDGGGIRRVEGVAVALPCDDVDTDAILPASGAREAGTDKAALARHLFGEWRRDGEGHPVPSFPLNRPEYAAARILVAGRNFGCGSSREHAVWALRGAGFRAVVASSFGDIFAGNCVRNRLVPACVRPEHLRAIGDAVEALARGEAVTIDLEAMTISVPGIAPLGFELDPASREMLLGGIDEIGATLKHLDAIRMFQEGHARVRPWVYGVRP